MADIETRAGFLAGLLAFHADAVFLAVHDGMLAADHAADGAQRIGKLFLRRHGRPLLVGHVLGLPAGQLLHVGLRAGIPGLRYLVPLGAGRLGRDALAVGNSQVFPLLGRFAAHGGAFGRLHCLRRVYGGRSGPLRPFCEGACSHTGRNVPGLFLPVPLRTQRLRLVFLAVGHLDEGLLRLGLGLDLARGLRCRRCGLLLAPFPLELGDSALHVGIVEHGRALGILAGLFSG